MLLGNTPVQADTCAPGYLQDNPDAIYYDNRNGTITDVRTGLMWRQCLEGRIGGALCPVGSTLTFTWTQALARARNSTYVGYTDWRLPSVRELLSLVEHCRASPALSPYFATSESNRVWTASPYQVLLGAWYVDFGSGFSGSTTTDQHYAVRLVRDTDVIFASSFDSFTPY